ncbi:MAG: hypothetical protein ACYCYF_05725 [Anaerolineae bacterium]
MDVWGIALGAALATVGGLLGYAVERNSDRCDRKRHAEALLAILVYEAREGVRRCESLAQMLQEGKASYSRVYVAAWGFAGSGLAEHGHTLKLPAEVLPLMHRLYYRFDLVNLNMESAERERGGAFAAEYIGEMREDLARLEALLCQRDICLPGGGHRELAP